MDLVLSDPITIIITIKNEGRREGGRKRKCFRDDEHVFDTDYGESFTGVYFSLESSCTHHVQLCECKSYLNKNGSL